MSWCNSSSVAEALRNRSRRWCAALAAIAAAAGAGVGATFALAGGPAQPPLYGTLLDRAVPNLRLENEQGKTISLEAFRGRTVVLAPFLTLCHEVCPLTTSG